MAKKGAKPVKESVFVMKPPPGSKFAIKYDEVLNEEQIQAVFHNVGPAIIIAGAGSGKTRVLTYRVAKLLEQGVQPRAIMLVTFTRKAAEEMTSRVEALTKIPKTNLVSGTFHSISNRFLRKYAQFLGFESNFSILDESDATNLMKKALAQFFMGKDNIKELKERYPKPADLREMYSTSMNQHLIIRDVLAGYYTQYQSLESDIRQILQNYFDLKKKFNVMDFDDLLVYFLRLLRTEGINVRLFDQIHHLLVDEYQDVNQLQADIVIELGRRCESVTVVGDDAQAIYSFRGASIKHMLEFEEMFDTPTKKYFLTSNYRSTPQILDLANESIKHNKKQFKKTLKTTKKKGTLPEVVPAQDEDEEANFICQKILSLRSEGMPLEEQAVLFRSAVHSLKLEHLLTQYKIPYIKRAGVRFYESAHFKDLFSMIFLIDNPAHELAWTRLLNLIPNVGPKTTEQIITKFINAPDPLLEFTKTSITSLWKTKKIEALDILTKLQQLFKSLILDPKTGARIPEDKLSSPSDMIENCITFYKPLCEGQYKNHQDRLVELREFVNIAARYETLKELVQDVAVSETFVSQTRLAKTDDDEAPLVLTTIHQAKGLEWDAVYIIRMVENSFPSPFSVDNQSEIEEERRLFYVATTRARKKLFLTYPLYSWSNYSTNVQRPSRFIDEIREMGVFQVTSLKYGSFGITRFEDLI